MSTAIAPVEVPAAADPRMAAFLAPNCPEVFHSVATPTAIWQANPYDVETIHAEAREAFDRLLYRGGRTPPPPSGAVLVLLGEAGSGKTHLMRAFRTRAHGQGLGYCGYLQMTTEASNYARYMLTNLIDGLEQPYAPDGPSRTGLARLSAALLESVPELTPTGREAFREGEGDPTRLADDYADRLHATGRFRYCDLELVRVMLHLERNEPRVRSRALMWLRCQEMRPQDREWICGAVPRTDDADPMRMLIQLARLTDAVHGVPLVLLIDQLEDMANQSAPVERFLKVVDAITAFTDTIPNAVVVLACLEDYFKTNVERLTKAKHDRLVRDPEPLRLLGNRTLEEIRTMTARRLAYLYDTAEVEVDPMNELYPFRDEHLAPLNGKRTRDALDSLRQHHQGCITASRWNEPQWSISPLPPPPRPENELDEIWNDFHSTFPATVPDGQEELAGVLADAIRAATAELPGGFHFGCAPPEGRYLEVETHKADNSIDKLLVAVCNANTRGTGFANQISELAKRAGEITVAIVRTTDFPKSGKAITQIAGMLKRHGEKVVAANAEWRRMLAFEAFRKQHEKRPDFATWQRTARPLGELNSLQRILRLNALTAAPRPAAVAPAMPPARPAPPVTPAPAVPVVPAPLAAPLTRSLVFGRTLSLTPAPVIFEPDEFVHHAAFLGGTGSGKTTAALNLIEQLLARDVPAVLLDRKGDLCRYVDPAAWDRPLGDPARAAARQSLRDKLDVAVFTPGEPNGRPLALPVVPPGFDQLQEADRERFAQYAAGALGSMIGFKTSDADKGQRAILAKAIETLASVPGSAITVPVLRDVIEQQDDALLNAIGGGYPDRYYATLAQRLLTLELNNKQLLTGSERLDVDALLGTGPHARPGRVRLSVVSTRFLDAAKVDFWVSQLLVAVSRWCAKSPQQRLQAVFLFDEADVYLPAGTRQPATKAPMEDLLKRARSAGVGIFLATQSPGDFDYKCKENVRTWLIGRVKEPRALEKLKPMLAAAKGGVTNKLAGQATGEFYLVRESSVIAVRSDESFMRTEQVPESQIAQLAHASV
jgi:hypothetical protein